MKITILDSATFGSDLSLDSLKELGRVTVYESTSAEQIKGRVYDAEVLVINKAKINREVIDSAPNLRLICVFATGYDNIDVEYAKQRGIAVCNVPGYSTDSVALYTVSTALALYTRLKAYSSYVSNGSYSSSCVANKLEPVYHELRGKVWGIIGCGNIGSAVARVAQAFGARVIVYKRKPIQEYECCELKTLLTSSDIITIHCPLNDESRSLINAETIQYMKKDVCLVNAARGAVVDERAIADAIKEKKIGAFGSDVYTVEPFGAEHPFYEIKDYQNVILTPHCAWGAYEARVRCINIICENIKAFFNKEIKNRVDI